MALKDLEQLLQEVADPGVRPLVREVVKSYEAGALRAATVSLWIAVVADLTFKIRQLAESGDGAAANVIADLDDAVSRGAIRTVQDYERDLLVTAERDLGILTAREKTELSRLNEDRNLCAHPGFQSPSDFFVPDSESVRAHLVAAHKAVFSQKPLAGKRLLEMLAVEIEGDSWPEEGEYFLARFFRNAREGVRQNIAKILIKHSLRPPDESNRTAKRSRDSVYAIAAESPAAFEGGLSSVIAGWESSGVLGERELVRAVGCYGDRETFWGHLPDTALARLEAYLLAPDIELLIDQRFFVSGAPAKPGIAASFNASISEMDSEQLRRAMRQARSRMPFIDRIVERIQNSVSFRGAEGNLRLLELCADELTPAHVVALRKAIEANRRSQVRLAGETEAILVSIHAESQGSQDAEAEWRELARWLRQAGVDGDDEHYHYDELCDAVGVED